MSQPSSTRRLLLPLVPLYRLALGLRELRLGSRLEPVHRLRFPVVSIGSLSAGGSGKTPLAIALAQALKRRGWSVDVLSRGYGRQDKGALRVDLDGTAEEFGDEPLLIAREAGVPVYVAAQRYQAGLLAENSLTASINPVVHLLDDGFQHRQLHRHVNILLLDGRDLKDHLLPAGNLREPLSAMQRATILAIPADDPELEAKLKAKGWHGPIWLLHRRMEVPPIDGPIVAFCGIARSDESRPEFTLRALLLGSFFGIVFGAVTVYVGLRAGLTVAASIPIAVLSISILRAFGRASILENNIVQTTGNAGQSIAAGVIFTLPALIFLGFDLEYSRIFLLALIGGWLGVLFMIPLRRQLIVEEHGNLAYPEGTACADVLIAGERGGSLASRVFLGLGLGALYTFFQNENLFKAWPGTPEFQPDFGPQHILKGASIKADATPSTSASVTSSDPRGGRHLRRRRLLLAGPDAADLLLRQGTPPSRLSRHRSHCADGPQRPLGHLHPPMGAGAVAAAGLITLIKTLPTIFGALASGVQEDAPGSAARANPPY
jgi:tetraacyldisaccharide 4'-kinase